MPLPPRSSGTLQSPLHWVFVVVFVDLAHEVHHSPLPRTSFAPRLGFCTVGIPFSSFTVGAALSKPFAKYLSVSVTCVLSGNTSVSNFTASSRFRIRKSIGRGHASRLFQAFGLALPLLLWYSSRGSVTANFLSLARTLLPPPSWHLTARFPPLQPKVFDWLPSTLWLLPPPHSSGPSSVAL